MPLIVIARQPKFQRLWALTDTLQMTYIPQLLAEYIQYQYIKIQLTYIFPIVGRIYPIQMNIKQGPNLPGPNLAICWGTLPPRGPICRQGAQSAGARFAKKWQIGPQKVRGPICRQIGEGPNLPGPNLPGPNLPRTLFLNGLSLTLDWEAFSERQRQPPLYWALGLSQRMQQSHYW